MADNSSFSGSDWLRFMANQPSSPISTDAIKANAIGMGNTLHNTLGIFNRRGPLYQAAIDPKAYLEGMKTPSAEEMAMAFNPAHLGAMAVTTKLYSGVNKAAAELPRTKGTGKEFMTELSKKPGVKKAELADRNLHEINDLPKMTKDEFQAELAKRPKPTVTKKILSNDAEKLYIVPHNPDSILDERHWVVDSSGEPVTAHPFPSREDAESHIENHEIDESGTHHEGFKLPGGNNYQEHLYKYEPEGQKPFVANEHHFGAEPNVLASARTVDRKTPEGKKILHVEEIQSDWHQQGREKGYKQNALQQYQNEINRLASKYGVDTQNKSVATIESELNHFLTKDENAKLDQLEEVRSADLTAVPDAPFKKNWEEMVSKDLIKHAVDNGYDGIALTPGTEQADRYNLSKHVDSVTVSPTGNGNYRIDAQIKGGGTKTETNLDANGVEAMIGKELASKLIPAADARLKSTAAMREVATSGDDAEYNRLRESRKDLPLSLIHI